MATPLTEIIKTLREVSKTKKTDSKNIQDAMLSLMKMDNDKEIRLLSTQIGGLDNDYKVLSADIRARDDVLSDLTDSIKYRVGEASTITKPEQTKGAGIIGEDVYAQIRIYGERNDAMRIQKDKYGTAIYDAKRQLLSLEKLDAYYNKGTGVTDVDKSGTVDVSDVGFEQFLKTQKFDPKKDSDILELLGKYDKRLTPNIEMLENLNAAFLEREATTLTSKAAIQDNQEQFYKRRLLSSRVDNIWRPFYQLVEEREIAFANKDSEAYEEVVKDIERTKFDMFESMTFPHRENFDDSYYPEKNDEFNAAAVITMSKVRKDVMESGSIQQTMADYELQILEETDVADREVIQKKFDSLQIINDVGKDIFVKREQADIGDYRQLNQHLMEEKAAYDRKKESGNIKGAENIVKQNYTLWGIDILNKESMGYIQTAHNKLEEQRVTEIVETLPASEGVNAEDIADAEVSNTKSRRKVLDEQVARDAVVGITPVYDFTTDEPSELAETYKPTNIGTTTYDINPGEVSGSVGGGRNVGPYQATNLREQVEYISSNLAWLNSQAKALAAYGGQKAALDRIAEPEPEPASGDINIEAIDPDTSNVGDDALDSLNFIETQKIKKGNWVLNLGEKDESTGEYEGGIGDGLDYIRANILDMPQNLMNKLRDPNISIDDKEFSAYMVSINPKWKQAFLDFQNDPEEYSDWELMLGQLKKVQSEFISQSEPSGKKQIMDFLVNELGDADTVLAFGNQAELDLGRIITSWEELYAYYIKTKGK